MNEERSSPFYPTMRITWWERGKKKRERVGPLLGLKGQLDRYPLTMIPRLSVILRGNISVGAGNKKKKKKRKATLMMTLVACSRRVDEL